MKLVARGTKIWLLGMKPSAQGILFLQEQIKDIIIMKLVLLSMKLDVKLIVEV